MFTSRLLDNQRDITVEIELGEITDQTSFDVSQKLYFLIVKSFYEKN